ncbi:reprolysin-like metallopeptidase [Flavobacterium sp.]|uniref:zinc-dependent metalloprotease n=1 Tax=Flavobacterium sp. TaxID=239 RepID=UPI00286A54DF|nr:zinc-dependent metalloprotease family protein [Flavobacterium sp.]
MKKQLLTLLTAVFFLTVGHSQTDKLWSAHNGEKSNITTDKAVARLSFPKEFKLYDLNIELMRNSLFSVIGKTTEKSLIITLPNADGKIEQFKVFEASNFEPDLQAKFPEIRAFSGQGITDKYATLKLSISPQGIQTMIFRTDRENEFIEAYSEDHAVYAVFKSQREKGKLAWSCSTDDQKMVSNVTSNQTNTNKFDDGKLRVARLAQSCNAEYANYFGATSAAQVSLVLAAFNATLTRCNGVYEKDLALHLNLVAGSTNIIYYDPATDPYSTTLSQWNTQLQIAINTTLTGTGTTLAANNAAYDIGHLFGKSGGGGNAGCIGCICVDAVASGAGSTKGRGITSPSDGIPQGDTFDIDYVVHEVGHQIGGTHTFSNSNEGSGTNKEVGSGITIMGYAGITSQDVAPNSIDAYHQTSIAQIQANLATKTCPVTTTISADNATPVVSPVSNYTIPKSTPFVLTGAATDSNAGDALTYSWEQNDDGGTSTGAASSASPTKIIGPNFLSFRPTVSPLRYFPKLSSVIANSNTTLNIGGDAGILTEALSSVSRTLNFRLTVRDNSPYSSTPPLKVGQTAFTDMVVTVNAAAGPFLVNSPNTAVTWFVGANQSVNWDVAGTTANGINTASVDIFLSTDSGLTYPIQLASQVPNSGNATIVVPNNVGTTNRVMVKGYQNVFFDISNVNFSIVTPTSTFAISESGPLNNQICVGTATSDYNFNYNALGGFSGTTTFSATGNPPGSTVAFSPATMGATSGAVTMNVSGLAGVAQGSYNITAIATSGSTTSTIAYVLNVGVANTTLTTPVDNAITQNTSLTLSWALVSNATSYDVQIATDAAFASIVNSGNVITNNYSATGLAQGTSYFWRVLPKNAICLGTYSTGFKFTTGTINCTTTASTNIPVTIPATANVNPINSTLNIPSGGNISDLNATISIDHTYTSDMTISLISPAGTEIQLAVEPCGTSDNINATFDDSGIAVVCGTNPAISGTVLPAQPLSGFNGQNSTGTWTLRVRDPYNNDGGKINSWSLKICTLAPLGVQNNEFTNFSLFPNPNNGMFTVKFTSESSNDIMINVNDLRGRQVFEKKYSNNGAFNQNISLDKLESGVYLVSIIDGEKKTVKRIIVE